MGDSPGDFFSMFIELSAFHCLELKAFSPTNRKEIQNNCICTSKRGTTTFDRTTCGTTFRIADKISLLEVNNIYHLIIGYFLAPLVGH